MTVRLLLEDGILLGNEHAFLIDRDTFHSILELSETLTPGGCTADRDTAVIGASSPGRPKALEENKFTPAKRSVA